MAQGKAINELANLSTAQAADDTKLLFVGLAGNGALSNMTVGQAKAIYGTQKVKYLALGTEGNTITIPALAAKFILSVVREGAYLHEGSNVPDPAEYYFNGASITFASPLNQNERITILYRYA
jgi:hypothetical protein